MLLPVNFFQNQWMKGSKYFRQVMEGCKKPVYDGKILKYFY